MKKVQRSEIVDYQTYEEQREAFRAQVLVEKEKRRVHLGEHLTFLFETTETVRYQVQEMMRIEHIVREKDIQHELDTYNELLGATGELGCTLLIEIDDPKERDDKLRRWLELPQHLYVELEGGARARAIWDERQVGSDRLSSVQYIKFRTGVVRPVAVGVDHPALSLRAALSPARSDALYADLRE